MTLILSAVMGVQAIVVLKWAMHAQTTVEQEEIVRLYAETAWSLVMRSVMTEETQQETVAQTPASFRPATTAPVNPLYVHLSVATLS